MKANSRKNLRRIRALQWAEQDLKIEEIRIKRYFWDTPARRERIARLRETIQILRGRIVV